MSEYLLYILPCIRATHCTYACPYCRTACSSTPTVCCTCTCVYVWIQVCNTKGTRRDRNPYVSLIHSSISSPLLIAPHLTHRRHQDTHTHTHTHTHTPHLPLAGSLARSRTERRKASPKGNPSKPPPLLLRRCPGCRSWA